MHGALSRLSLRYNCNTPSAPMLAACNRDTHSHFRQAAEHAGVRVMWPQVYRYSTKCTPLSNV